MLNRPKVIAVVFKNDKEYNQRTQTGWGVKTYYYLSHEAFNEGDFAIVDAPSGLAIVKVTGIDPSGHEGWRAYKWIVQRIDLDAYKKRKERHEEVSKLTQQLHQLVARRRDMELFQSVLGSEPEAKELLERLKELQDLEAPKA